MLKLSGCPRLTWGRSEGDSMGCPPRCAARVSVRILRLRCLRARRGTELLDDHRMPRRTKPGTRFLGKPHGQANGKPLSAPHCQPDVPDRGGATVRDAQADVPSAKRLRAQLAFKDSMVHGILQFTPSIAFRYVLHRCESRDIRCRESLRRSVEIATFLRFPWRMPRPSLF